MKRKMLVFAVAVLATVMPIVEGILGPGRGDASVDGMPSVSPPVTRTAEPPHVHGSLGQPKQVGVRR